MMLLLFITFICMITTCQGCSCLPVHPQTYYCDADFVIRFKPISVVVPAEEIDPKIYTVKVIDTFKGICQKGRKLQLYTGANGGQCGVSLDMGEKPDYLVSGTIDENGEWTITSCDWIDLWDDVKPCIRRILNNCKCEEKYCEVDDEDCEAPELLGCVTTSLDETRDYMCGCGGTSETPACSWKECEPATDLWNLEKDDVSGGMCRDWNNTLIASGEMFSPKASDLCYRCGCYNGRSVACRSVTCMRPPCEGALTPVEGVCCRFVCTIEPEPSTDGESCRDWNNTVVPHGETFSPERSDPCYQCACYNGRRVSCKDVGCMRPPCEGGTLTPVEGECCQFICRIGPQPEPEPNTDGESCRDWNNTVVPHGETFSPERSDPCYQCACYNGRRVSCMDVGCIRPPCEDGTLTPVEGECCQFICRIGPQPEPNTVPEECPEGWTMYASKCYYLSRDKMNWIDSQMMCETINGKLVQIVSANENSFVRNFTSTSGISNFWIGVTDLEVLGTYKYPGEDGPIQFSDWKRRRPVVSKRFNCVEIKTAKVYNWRPTNCSKRLPFVCEREP